MEHETENLRLDSDGSVWLACLDEDGERDWRCLGDVDSCGYRVPNQYDIEFEEICETWERWRCEQLDYLGGVEAAWNRAKGW